MTCGFNAVEASVVIAIWDIQGLGHIERVWVQSLGIVKNPWEKKLILL